MKLPRLLNIMLAGIILCCGCARSTPVIATVSPEIDHGEGQVVGADKTFLNNTSQTQETHADTDPTAEKKVVGNSSALIGNILNSGIVCEQDGYVYYSKKEDANRLCRMDKRGNSEPVGEITGAININAYEEGIVYQSGGIYRYDFETDESVLLVEASCRNVYLYEGKIYYLKKTEDFYKMYCIGLDGKEEQMLSENIASFMNVVDGEIYYIAGDDEGHIHKMNLDGSKDTVISSFGGVEEMVVCDGTIYYVSNSDSGCQLWRISPEGKDDRKIYGKECHNINVCDHVIYFREQNRQMLCSVWDDGTHFEELLEAQCTSINMVSEWIYYFDADDMKYYRVRKDGTGVRPVE